MHHEWTTLGGAHFEFLRMDSLPSMPPDELVLKNEWPRQQI
jgi:hypothetical protein